MTNTTQVTTGEVRLSYAYLTAPNANGKYSVALLIPKTDAATVTAVRSAIEVAAAAAVAEKWGGIRPPVLPELLHDGDGVKQDGTPYGAECNGHWVLNANSNNPPGTLKFAGGQKVPAVPQDVYSGMYGYVALNFFGYSFQGKKGVGCGLNHVLKTRDGELFGGGVSADEAFADISAPPAAAAANPW